MEIALIAALDKNNGIGKNGNLLCYLPADLKRFKSLTINHSIVMGRKTFESLPKGALPKRRNIVLTTNANYKADGITVATSIEGLLEICSCEEKIFIIGGGTIYKQFLPKATHLYITRIHHTFEADTFFSDFNEENWNIIEETYVKADENNKYDFSFIDYGNTLVNYDVS